MLKLIVLDFYLTFNTLLKVTDIITIIIIIIILT